MDSLNTVKAHHFTVTDGVMDINERDYFWHIPKALRVENIKKGDIILVKSQGKKKEVIVVDVFRENVEDTGKKYKPMLAKIKDADCSV